MDNNITALVLSETRFRSRQSAGNSAVNIKRSDINRSGVRTPDWNALWGPLNIVHQNHTSLQTLDLDLHGSKFETGMNMMWRKNTVTKPTHNTNSYKLCNQFPRDFPEI